MEFEDQHSHLHSRVERIRKWVGLHRPLTILLVGLFLIALVGGIAYAAWVISTPKPTKPVSVIIRPKPKYYSALTGERVKDEEATTKPVTAIMIENSPDARPQSGLKDAEVVYEAVAEGGITRFLTLFQQHKPHLIGPVRSVRLYYVDWLTPYDASVAHVGGSAKALALVRNGHYRDIDQFFNAEYYWRATDRYAPHNVYTSFAKLDELNKVKGYKTSHPKAFERGETPIVPVAKQNAKTVSITISSDLYNSKYIYNAKTGLYKRYEAGAPHNDREKGQIAPKVVVALRVNMQQVLEDGYRESIKTSGTGNAVIFQNGKATKVTWHKPTRSSQLSFTDSEGKPFTLARGTTWITAVPNDGGNVTWR